MENQQPAESPEKESKGFRLFAAKRIVIGTVAVLALLWGASYVLTLFESHDAPGAPHAPTIVADHGAKDAHGQKTAAEGHAPKAAHDAQGKSHAAVAAKSNGPADDEHGSTTSHAAAPHDSEPHGQASGHAAETKSDDAHRKAADDHAPAAGGHEAAKKDTHTDAASGHGVTSKAAHAAAGHAATKDKDHATAVGEHAANAAHGEAEDAHGQDGHGQDAHGGHGTIAVSDVKGVTFVMAAMAPLQHELEERFYGWRPNDIIRPTDNVNNFQIGVLEVTRRTVEALTERMSRTGSVQAFDKDLERARNNLMINADDYMLPSAESSYEEALAALGRYKVKLEKGMAPFYTRTVNLIPLLDAYANLLGSCDDNLVKAKEDDGSKVSSFQSDNYFFYAQGVASAMHTIMQAVAVEFETLVESRRGSEVLHHAIEALHHATEVDPLIIFNGDYDGFLANHRANLAAHISHARFYVKLLIQTLST